MSALVRWSDEADAVIKGDITAAAAYLTPAGGAVVTAVAPYAGDTEAVYAPHTYKGFVAPPRKNLLLVSNGLIAKFGSWQARRQGRAGQLEELARGSARPGEG